MFDLIIKNATVIDGSGAAGFFADVALLDGKIAAVGTVTEPAHRELDATGLVLTPGFIDSHSHSDGSLITNPDMHHGPEQGITFALGGQCGYSISPYPNSRFVRFSQLTVAMDGQFLGMNMGVLTGHGTLRKMVGGSENRPLTQAELDEMCRLLEESMSEGSMGLSLGLTYPPGSYADFRELATLAAVVGKMGGILTAHIRNESDELLESVQEFIDLCREGKCRGVISHLKAADKANHGKVRQVLAMIEAAAAQGIEVYADAYPYCASSTSLSSRFVPRKFHPAGTTSVIRLLDDPALRQRIKAWATEKWGTDLSWVLITSCPSIPEYVGKTMNEIADAMGMDDRYEAVFTLLQQTKGYCSGCFTMMCPEDVAYVLAHPRVMVGCDSDAGKVIAQYHPRRVGTFPRVLGRYVREQQITSLPEMIRKMTSLPAQVYKLDTKGRIAPGYDGDICIFDPATIRDTADYVNCTSPNQGIYYVLVGGQIVVENGKYTGTRAGKLYTHRVIA